MQRCDCCGGSLPVAKVWNDTRDDAKEDCTGSIHPSTGRCRAFADDSLWYTLAETASGHAVVRGTDGATAEFLDEDDAAEALTALRDGASEKRYEWAE